LKDSPVDTRRLRTYSTEKATWKFMAFGAAFTLTGLLLTVLPHTLRGQWWSGVIIAMIGLVWCLVCQFRLFNPGKPLLELSPQGLTLRTVGNVFIPWHEIRAVESIDRSTWPALYAPLKVTFTDLTVVVISRDFYYDHILPEAPVLSGRAWDNTFISKSDNLIQVGIHHDILPATPAELRREIAARWYAFRGDHRGADPVKSTPAAADKPTTSADKSAKKINFRIRWDKS